MAPLAPLQRCDAELTPIPARESARCRKAEHQRHLGERSASFRNIALRELASHAFDDGAERKPFVRETAVDRPTVDAEMLRHALDRARPGAEQRDDELAHLDCEIGILALQILIEHLLREARDASVGVQVW